MFSVIVPVHDEAGQLPRFVAVLLTGLPFDAEVWFALNGCHDSSAEVLSRWSDPRLHSITLPLANKAAAIRAAEAATTRFPRFFVDADVIVEGHELIALAGPLLSEEVEMTAPRLVLDCSGLGWICRSAAEVWQALPHARTDAFQTVIGVSRAGRERWGDLPDILADDSFMAAQIPPRRRRIMPQATAIVHPPATVWAWLGTRHRHLAGLAQLQERGMARPRAPRQRRALANMIVQDKDRRFAAIAYLGLSLAARIAHGIRSPRTWFRDETSRTSGDRRPAQRGRGA